MLDKWQELLNKCKSIGRTTSIWIWHEETLAIMKTNLYELNKKKLMSAKTTNF